MNLCDNCTYAKECALAHAYAGEIIGCPKRKPLTNYDRLISNSPEELADWLNQHFVCPPKSDCPKDEASCEKCWLDWLKQEVTND